jgi:N-acetyl-anhydromuramyl-L-alanine amidase AmpD
MRTINEIIIHCSATTPSMKIDAEWIRKVHVEQNGWKDIGYHFVITRDGLMDFGREVAVIGAHCKGHNANSIGICLVGGINQKGKPEDNFTPAQFVALKQLIAILKEQFPGIVKLSGHNDYDKNKACPSFKVSEKLTL